jgi:mitogen-activated protein kinase kinase 1 interacting protein 1
MENKFNEICSRLFYSGLLVAMVTDRDGVIILKSKWKKIVDISLNKKKLTRFCLGVSDKAKENMTEPIIPTTFAIANNQVR